MNSMSKSVNNRRSKRVHPVVARRRWLWFQLIGLAILVFVAGILVLKSLQVG